MPKSTRSRARVLVVGLLKGGTGKTKVAVLTALFLAVVLGRRVLLIDADSISQTTYDWYRACQRAGVWPDGVRVLRHPFDDLDEVIDEHAGEVDDVVVDVGGGNRVVFEAALSRADKLISPVGADPSETDRLPATWRSAQAAAAASATGFVAHVVLSRTDHGTTMPRECRAELTAADYPVTETEIVKRVAYQRVYKNVPTTRRGYLDVPTLLAEVGIITEQEAAR